MLLPPPPTSSLLPSTAFYDPGAIKPADYVPCLSPDSPLASTLTQDLIRYHQEQQQEQEIDTEKEKEIGKMPKAPKIPEFPLQGLVSDWLVSCNLNRISS